MAFEDSSQTSGPGSRYLGEGFRHEPDFRELASGATLPGREPASGATMPGRESTVPLQAAAASSIDTIEAEPTLTLGKRLSAPNLDYVFDDPTEGEPGRDRMLVHGLWELMLAVAVAGLAYLLYREDSTAFGGDGLRTLLLGASALGAVAAGSAVALRAGVPNLAVGAVAAAAALYFGHNSDGGLVQPLLVVIGVCAAIGLVQGLVVVGLQVPAWAASIGAGFLLLIWSERQAGVTLADGYDPQPHAYWWFGGFCAISVVAGLVGLVPPVRRGIGRFRPVADPAYRRGLVAALIALAATVVSTILAGIGGVLAVSISGQASASAGFEVTGLALGAALLGGTSAFGRRGGVLGTVLAVGLITVAMAYSEATDRTWPTAAFAAAAIGLGLAATRLVERFGRPEAGEGDDDVDEEDWGPKVHSSPGNGGNWPSGSSPAAAGGLWASDDAWGSTDRR